MNFLERIAQMFEKFYPNEYFDSTYSIDFEAEYKKGKRGLILDIDNTLVPHGADADERSIEFFERLKKLGFKICLLSNNKVERVERFNSDVNVDYIYDAHKPSVKGYNRAMEKMGTKKHETLFVGDQLFTDVYGANRAGIDTYLVKPIHPKEEIQIVLKRKLEKIVLHSYNKSREK